MSYTRVLPSLFHPHGAPKKVMGPLPQGLSSLGNMYITVHVGLSSSMGERHLLSNLYFVLCTDATQMPHYLPKTAVSSRRAEGEGRVRAVWHCQAKCWLSSGDSKRYSLCLILTTKHHCFWPSAWSSQNLYPNLLFLPSDWFMCLLLILKGGVNPSLPSAIPTSTD